MTIPIYNYLITFYNYTLFSPIKNIMYFSFSFRRIWMNLIRVNVIGLNSVEGAKLYWLWESMQMSVKISSGIILIIYWLWVTPKSIPKEFQLTKWIQVYSVQIKVDQIIFKNEY